MGGMIMKPVISTITSLTGAKTFGEVASQISGQKPIIPSPTTTEVSQSMAASAALAEAKRRGSSATNLTGGLGLSDQPVVLKTLLGQ